MWLASCSCPPEMVNVDRARSCDRWSLYWSSTCHLLLQQLTNVICSPQACLQVCIKATIEGAPEAVEFLQDSCATLKKAFATQPLLLTPTAGGVASSVAGGGMLSW